MPKALAAALIARSALLESTTVPRSMVKTRPEDSALERPRTQDVRRATSPFEPAPVPVNGAGEAYGNWPAQAIPETARRVDDRQTFLYRSRSSCVPRFASGLFRQLSHSPRTVRLAFSASA